MNECDDIKPASNGAAFLLNSNLPCIVFKNWSRFSLAADLITVAQLWPITVGERAEFEERQSKCNQNLDHLRRPHSRHFMDGRGGA